MNRVLYALAVILIIAWAFGFFAFNVGGIIHILLIVAVIFFLLTLMKGRRVG
ncbi:lmo0937 family membrane protein [Alistipes sp. ZOR0009]|uniref:lmo0937 family membrane protein n=1 Tax=Alistipes sp. ZOR0009 TaxID=1339253 RepID=UPI000A58532F|nr:lmo0937 family membrane protein [Alistipes sp. ZOR0009]